MCSKLFLMKMSIQMFLMIFQSLMDPRKSRCNNPNGTTEGQDCPGANENIYQYEKAIKIIYLH